MPAKPKQEIPDELIGARLRSFRETLKLTRAEMAKSLGIGLERLASYEDARAPLRWEIGKRLAELYRLNPRWLVRWDVHPFTPVESAILNLPIAPRELLSTAFETHLKQYIPASPKVGSFDVEELQELSADFGRVLGSLAGARTAVQKAALRAPWFISGLSFINAQLTYWLREAEKEELGIKTHLQFNSLPPFTGEHAGEKETKTLSLTKSPKADLMPSDMATAKQELAALLAKVRERTSERGMRKQLAAEIKVAPQRITDWLSGKKVPDGLNLLRLQKWVGGSR